jgi:hypothetical protein
MEDFFSILFALLFFIVGPLLKGLWKKKRENKASLQRIEPLCAHPPKRELSKELHRLPYKLGTPLKLAVKKVEKAKIEPKVEMKKRPFLLRKYVLYSEILKGPKGLE